MINENNKEINFLTKRKLNKGKGILILEEENKSKENSKIIEKIDSNNEISIKINKNFLEKDKNENKDLRKIKPKKKKLIKKKGNNEKVKKIKKKTNSKSSEKSSYTKKINHLKRKRKRTYKRKKENDEEYKINNTLYIFKNNKKSKYSTSVEESENNDFDENEIKAYINQKACNKKTLLKYKNIYAKKKNNKIIFLKEEDEEEYFNKKRNENIIKYNNNDNKNLNKKNQNEKKNVEIQIKQFKKLKKNIDNKEMELPLDTECVICCGIIKELAYPDECDHNFCKNCLIEWSKRSAKCPMCKKNYNNIFFYENGIKKQLSINDIRKNDKKEKNNNNNDENDDIEENIEKICSICKKK